MPVNDVFDVQVVVMAFLGLASTSVGAERVSARTTVRSFMVWCPCPMDIPVENIRTDTRARMKLQ